MSMTYLTGLIFIGQFFSTYFQKHHRFTAGLWVLAGLLFLGFALRLVLI